MSEHEPHETYDPDDEIRKLEQSVTRREFVGRWLGPAALALAVAAGLPAAKKYARQMMADGEVVDGSLITKSEPTTEDVPLKDASTIRQIAESDSDEKLAEELEIPNTKAPLDQFSVAYPEHVRAMLLLGCEPDIVWPFLEAASLSEQEEVINQIIDKFDPTAVQGIHGLYKKPDGSPYSVQDIMDTKQYRLLTSFHRQTLKNYAKLLAAGRDTTHFVSVSIRDPLPLVETDSPDDSYSMMATLRAITNLDNRPYEEQLYFDIDPNKNKRALSVIVSEEQPTGS